MKNKKDITRRKGGSRILLPLFLSIMLLTSGMVCSQDVALKSNLLYDATSTLNLGAEAGLAPQWSLDLSISYNPWSFGSNKKWKHFFIQPEIRYWLSERFNGHFFGLHLLGGPFNIGGSDLFGLNKNYRYQGRALGSGLSYGYQWILDKRWSLEASVGLGYIHALYDKYECRDCGKKLESNRSNGFFTPTRIAVSILYTIR